MEVHFTIDGEPKGKARPRMTKTGHTYTPKETVNFENYVKLCWRNAKQDTMLDGMIEILIVAYMQPPKSASKKILSDMLNAFVRPTKKPDFDNIGKAICDSLNGLAYRDDSQITDATIRKRYSDRPRVEVYLKEIRLAK